MSIPPLYNSFDDSQEEKCVFCNSSTNDIVMYGNKYTMYGVTFHNFCLVSIQILNKQHPLEFLSQFFAFPSVVRFGITAKE